MLIINNNDKKKNNGPISLQHCTDNNRVRKIMEASEMELAYIKKRDMIRQWKQKSAEPVNWIS